MTDIQSHLYKVLCRYNVEWDLGIDVEKEEPTLCEPGRILSVDYTLRVCACARAGFIDYVRHNDNVTDFYSLDVDALASTS